MAKNLNEIEKKRKSLLAIYRRLLPAQSWMMQLLSVIYEPTPASDIARCAAKCGRSTRDTSKLLEELIQFELIEATPNGLRAIPLIREPIIRATLQTGTLHTFIGAIRDTLWRNTGWSEKEIFTYEQALARLRSAFYQRNSKSFYEMLEHTTRLFPAEVANNHPLVLFCEPVDKQFMVTLPPRLLMETCVALLSHAVRNLEAADEAFNTLKDFASSKPEVPAPSVYLFPQWIYRGRPAAARKLLKVITGNEEIILRGWADFISGKYEQAQENFAIALKQWEGNPPTLLGIFIALSLIHEGNTSEAYYLCSNLAEKTDAALTGAVLAIQWFCMRQEDCLDIQPPDLPADPNPIVKLIIWLILYWEGMLDFAEYGEEIAEYFEKARHNGYSWFAAEAAEILARIEGNNLTWAAKLANIRKTTKTSPLVSLFKPKEPWQRPLAALLKLPTEIGSDENNAGENRLAWNMTFDDNTGICELYPVEQRLNSSGLWSKGRRISLQKLFEERDAFPFLTSQDLEICAAIAPVHYSVGRGSKPSYELDYDRALPALVTHPLVFLEGSNNIRLEITAAEPELIALKNGSNIQIKLEPEITDDMTIALSRNAFTRIQVTKISPTHQRLAKILGKHGLLIPEAGFEAAQRAVEELSSMVTVQTDLKIANNESETILADNRPRLHLMPAGSGLRLEILYRPFGQEGGYYRPGVGAQTIVADFAGKRKITTRNLRKEVEEVEDIIKLCPTLLHTDREDGIWNIDDAIDCLELLVELHEIAERIVIEWPRGGQVSIRGQSATSSLGLKIEKKNDWFAVSGKVEVDADLVIDMKRLIEMSRHSKGRFIPLGEDKYLALTDNFRKRIEEIAAFSEIKNDEIMINPLAALALEDIAEEAGELKADIEWKKQVGKLRSPQNFAVPSTLQTELRDYQFDGFQWLSTLAEWRVGACLADDMGLGKTIQTLALLTARGRGGPALVIAPTSVCFNWINETTKFTPSLSPQLFGIDDREKMLEDAGKFDLIVCSYAMLQQEAEILTDKKWHTIVLDEAQAIKNAATKRSKAAMALKGDFKMVTTGTPLENHLGELWNIFRFINPGLLGSHKRFAQRFSIPIEKDNSLEAKERLKKLIKPFILRRNKSQVLDELPSRTEITKTIAMSTEETAFYEALRSKALEDIENSREQSGNRRDGIQILAEIMRLRRACCNARLVRENADIESSKLKEFGEIAQELVENNHKALVFSQFVDHLQIIKDYLQEKGYTFQYLDGSTPAKKREQLVEDFQDGDGDFFLISLKAGGQGLNLTAADYVIHMDPWWNPAVEDQASDRAHRIGQTRPVTIYRLVTSGTIEEKILELHKHKRSLAKDLLEGSDLGGRISAEELLDLIRSN